jgi:ribosomal protein L34
MEETINKVRREKREIGFLSRLPTMGDMNLVESRR